ncbi:DnaJ-domain-containing protein [Microthyrium microscopicum]|uniref:DnaJ-domain-containing protein n=1 Tax=Microthyrium microscopicum TaxID=703497 RepID=A0A6A6UQK4_9PEZI|nr:DnaJ-domain-containing protein [Microthyrium microscopicum]
MSARASGTDKGSSANGDARPRNHHDGSSGRAYTIDQKAAVLRVRRCSPTAFYDILGLESSRTTCSEGEIKKAYRKLSLLTHPDKNGYDGADEAFKMVSRAFQVLSDADKKAKFDRFGGDPESRQAQAQASSPFSGFAGRQGGGGSSMFDDGPEISPEELFRQFFGGGGGGGFPGFGFETGPQFVFNMGGPGGVRVTHFGGGGPRRRPRQAGQEEEPAPLLNTLFQLLPLLLLFVLPLLSSLFSGSSAYGPTFRTDQSVSPHTKKLVSTTISQPYWVNPNDFEGLSKSQRKDLNHKAEIRIVTETRNRCQFERQEQEELFQEAQGWFSTDEVKFAKAKALPMKNCKKINDWAHRGII